MNPPETVADVIAAELKRAGVETIFGLPGGENVQLLDALRRAGIRYILVHNESSAVFMADVTARLTGKPGVCMTTLGPGAASAVAGVAHAYLDRAPVLVITAQIPDERRHSATHQYIDIAALYAPIAKGTFKAQPHNVRENICRALDVIWDGRPGPVHLQVTNEDAGKPMNVIDVGTKQSRVREDAYAASPSTLPSLRSGQALAMTQKARDILSRSHRPVIVAGLGLEPERPYDALRAFAEAANVPVICTPKAKGALPDDHPLAAGVLGLTRTDPAYELLDQADCILAVGFDVVELVKVWNYNVPLIWIAAWENRDPTIPSAVEFVGAMMPVLQELAQCAWQTDRAWGRARVAAHRAELSRQELSTPARGRMFPQQVLAAIRRATPRDVLFATDVGAHKILAALTWQTLAPNSFLVSNGLSCMGFALPAAIAASMVQSEKPVVCLTGDAGLLLAMGELSLLARAGTRVMVVVMNDGALDLIRAQQRKASKPVYGTEFNAPDFVRIAESFGIPGFRVRSEEECFVQMHAAVARPGPTLIEAMIDPVSYPTPPLKT